jgi:hypothetical protein
MIIEKIRYVEKRSRQRRVKMYELVATNQTLPLKMTVWNDVNDKCYFSNEPIAKPPVVYSLNIREVQEFFAQISQLSLTLAPTRFCGFDGATYELHLENGLNTVKFTWWNALPPEWETLENVVGILKRWEKNNSEM